MAEPEFPIIGMRLIDAWPPGFIGRDVFGQDPSSRCVETAAAGACWDWSAACLRRCKKIPRSPRIQSSELRFFPDLGESGGRPPEGVGHLAIADLHNPKHSVGTKRHID